MKNKTNERALLIEIARYPLKLPEKNSLDCFNLSRLDWEYILLQANRHGILPLLFKTVKETGFSNSVPPEILEKLQIGYLTTLMKNKTLLNDLKPVLKTFYAAEIPVILLKGAALCLTTYEDIALRPLGDVDILVKKKDVTKACDLLESQGFSRIGGLYRVPDSLNAERGCEWVYHKGNNVFELHWSLLDKLAPFPLEMQLFWDRAVEVNVDDAPALVMDPGNQLIHLCLHQFKHHWQHIRDLTDICLFYETHAEEIDWEQLTISIETQELGRCVYYNFMLANMILGMPLDGIPMKKLLGRNRPTIFATGIFNMISANYFDENLPRRCWEPLSVKGVKNKLRLLTKSLSEPVSRNLDDNAPARPQSVTFRKKVSSGVNAIYFYRHLVLRFPSYILRSLRDGRR